MATWQSTAGDGPSDEPSSKARRLKILLDAKAVASERERRATEGLGAGDTVTVVISGPDGREKRRVDGGPVPASTLKNLADRQPGDPEIEALGAALALGVSCVVPEGKAGRRHRLVRGSTIVIATTYMPASPVVTFTPDPDVAARLLINDSTGDLWMRPQDGWAMERYLVPPADRVAFKLIPSYRTEAAGRQTAVLWTLSSDCNEHREEQTDRCNLPSAAAFSLAEEGIPLVVAENRFRPAFSAVIAEGALRGFVAQFVDALERVAKRKAESYTLECAGDRLVVRDRRINPPLPLLEAEGSLNVQVRSLDWARVVLALNEQRLAGPVRLDVDARRSMARFSAPVLHGGCEVWTPLIRHGAPVSELLGPADLKPWLGPATPSPAA